ncbi:aminotransferase class III-fold pyridoxal phosphate-dependent enzyme [Formosa maritima]|uniref:Aminotransferase class III-fold pyridoxal phosphate-dependent enzyme n=1 Tax=Formosa maritima TaxID=2592046 RepID=A0A5D0GJV7_9FLAO|nr:aminotransferase class III-fold pyridoxal phosphate-dependent enzyme [Formosa maritima]TYA59080.1 aminotransferase class III-fold pyridoxal phosphate-dependent enzyme [Formosa maritima]
MSVAYSNLKIHSQQAKEIAKNLYNIEGNVKVLPGELDFNFLVETNSESYILKISRPDEDLSYLEFQQEMLLLVLKREPNSPKVFSDIHGNSISSIKDDHGNTRFVRLLSWIDGRLWSSVNPIKNDLLFSLGNEAGKITKALTGFEHSKAERQIDWDIAHAEWTFKYLGLFSEEQKTIVSYFQKQFEAFQKEYNNLRKSVVHNDANDNNILVSSDLINPEVIAIIDYGDAIYTQTINDLAVAIAYAIMGNPDLLSATLPIVSGYHNQYTLLEEELKYLYNLVAIRLIISVTKSALNKQKEPDNTYLLISEKPAWDVLKRWKDVDENLAYYSFRSACGFTAHPNENEFKLWTQKQDVSLNDFFPTLDFNHIHTIDMSIGSTWLGSEREYNDLELTTFKINRLQAEKPKALFAGGYVEIRPFYSTKAYQKEGNSGPEYRTTHLGVDFWVKENTPIHAPFDGQVFSIYNNGNNKDYGPTLILKHETDSGIPFYTLYGHLTESSLDVVVKGQKINKNDLIAYVGDDFENGDWSPHLHFQVMLNMLDNKHDFPGVAFPNNITVWKSICPNPNLLFKFEGLNEHIKKDNTNLIDFRKNHLGKSLSLSYKTPLKMERGSGVYLIDDTGRKYLDTVNNVAHVGHEHPKVVKAGQDQMAVLNTNSRYLHDTIKDFAKELLNTFPKELSVVHVVNSGSEANELALRMTKAYTKAQDMIAVEIGYHGNTNACIDISSYKFDGKGGQGAPEHTHIVPLPDRFRGLYQGDNTAEDYVKHVDEQINNIHKKDRKVAGFICESIISCGGQIELPKNYLKLAYQAVRKAGGLCIADEVQTGCGRVGHTFWGFQLHDVIPDIVTIGKPIGNGHPLAAVVCTQEVANAFANGMEYFNTFGGNPVSCAIGKEVLQVIKDENLQENALKVGTYLKNELINLQKEFPIIGDVRGQGLFLGFELTDEVKHPLAEKASYLANRMKDFGVLMSTDGKDLNALKIKPPLVFLVENADELLSRLKQIFKEDFMKY